MNILWAISLHLVTWISLCDGKHIQPGRSWTFRDKDGKDVEVVPAHLFRRGMRPAQEHERYKRCSCYCRRKWEREYSCCECADRTCFPATATVTTATGDVTTIDSLKYGDRIMTASTDGSLSTTEVIGYIQRQRDVISPYWQITTSHARLLLSRSHLVFVSKNGSGDYEPRYASDVAVADHVLVRDGSDVIRDRVQSVDVVGARGAYVPLTLAGTLLVDDVLVSCYASFPHHVAHATLTPLRWSPWLLSWTPEDGTHPLVEAAKSLGRAVLPETWLFKGGNATGFFTGAESRFWGGEPATPAAIHSEL